MANSIKTIGGYETPSVEIMDVVSEGVFCVSIEDWEYDDGSLDF